jgi:DNA primase
VDPRTFLHDELPDLREYPGDWAWACCPFHPDTNPSFTCNLNTGYFVCKSSNCGVSGCGAIDFLMKRDGMDFVEARDYLETRYE